MRGSDTVLLAHPLGALAELGGRHEDAQHRLMGGALELFRLLDPFS
jgi:hypothetical protein